MSLFTQLRKRVRHWFGRSDQERVTPVYSIIDDSDATPPVKHHKIGLVPYDENLLERSRTQWQFGDWDSLIKLERETLQHHPDRAKLALLAAAGHMQTGSTEVARQYTRLAQDWGCSKKLVSQILIAGVHNSLGRAAAIDNQEQRAIGHFEASIATAMPQADVRLLGQNRIIRETAKLGLLPQAARLMGEELSTMKNAPGLESARLNNFETELGMLREELALAQQRQQLYAGVSSGDALIAHGTEPSSPFFRDTFKKLGVSEFGQDLWVLEKTAYKRNGYFVEFGATDGVLLSNTWLLEKEFGWQGICAEPNPTFYSQLKNNRLCRVADAYIGGITGKQVEFISADVYGTSVDYANQGDHADKRMAYRDLGQVLNLSAIALNDFLKQHDAPYEIDYLSIDTEGSEFEILENFPFDSWSIRLLTVAHSYPEQRKKIRDLLERYGYRCTEQQGDDWYEKLNR